MAMKLNKVEKSIGVLVIIVFITCIIQFNLVCERIEDAGGIKAVIIDVGKDLKDINDQINMDE